MGVFDGIEDAEGFGSGLYLEGAGVYIVQIALCKADKTRDGEKFFACEFDILASNNPKFPVGIRATWWVGIKDETPALKNIRVFMAKATGIDEGDVTAAGSEMICGSDQPLAGTVMRLKTKNVVTKKKGTDFTVHEWEPYEGTHEQIDSLRRQALLAA